MALYSYGRQVGLVRRDALAAVVVARLPHERQRAAVRRCLRRVEERAVGQRGARPGRPHRGWNRRECAHRGGDDGARPHLVGRATVHSVGRGVDEPAGRHLQRHISY